MASALSILFENKDVIAVDKPTGVPSIPGRIKDEVNLLALLTAQTGMKLFVVHRLDKDVSGIILFAKNGEAHKFLNDQFAERSLHKTYIGLTHGLIPDDHGVIERPIRQFGSGRMGVDEVKGKPCRTEFEVMDRFSEFTLVKIRPYTGRRHQIRVHFFGLGYPIVGDRLYGNSAQQTKYPRLMLHAQELEFDLPREGSLQIQSPLPDSFRNVMTSLQRGANPWQ